MTFTSPLSATRHRPPEQRHGLGGSRPAAPSCSCTASAAARRCGSTVAPRFEDDHRVVLLDLVGAGGSDLAAYDPVEVRLAARLRRRRPRDPRGPRPPRRGLRRPLRRRRRSACSPRPRTRRASGRSCSSARLRATSTTTTTAGASTGPTSTASSMRSTPTTSAGRQTMAPVIMGNAERPDLGAELTDSFCTVDPEIARHFARVTFLSDNRRDLSAVRTPTLVLQCSDDVIAPTSVGGTCTSRSRRAGSCSSRPPVTARTSRRPTSWPTRSGRSSDDDPRRRTRRP